METRAPRWAVVLGLAVAYFASARLGLALALPPDYKATAVWPPSGLALAAVLLWGRRVWPGVWLGSFLANAWDALDPARGGALAAHLAASAGIATGSTLQALAGRWLLRRLGVPGGAPGRAGDAFRFVAASSAACLIAPTAGAAALWGLGLTAAAAVPAVWWTWWLGDLVGILVVAPAALALARPGRRRAGGAEAWALVALLVAAGGVVLGGWLGPGVRAAPLAYLSLPLVVWAAVRFGPRGAALTVLAVAGFAVRGTAHGSGPFAHADVHQALLLLDVFLAVAAVTGLAVCAVLGEREAAEAALRASEEQFRQLAEALPQIVWRSAADGATTYLNRRWAEYTGLPGAGPDDLARVVHPDDLAAMLAAWAAAGAAGVFEHEFRLRPAGGGPYRWFLARAVPARAPGGAAGWLGTSTDIDDLKRAQAEAAAGRAELQLILDTVPALIFYKDRSHRLVRANDELCRAVGLPRAALEGRTDTELGLPHADGYRAQEEAVMRDGAPRTAVEPLHTFAGTRWLQTTKVAYRDAAGRVAGVLGCSIDVTERKAAEDEVRRLNGALERRVAERTAEVEARAADLQRAVDSLRGQGQLLQTVMDGLAEAVLVADTRGRVLLRNRAFRALHPEPAGLAGLDELAAAVRVYLPDGVTPCPPGRRPLLRALAGEPCDGVELVVADAANPGGVPVSVTGRPIVGPGGVVEGGVITVRDVSAAKAAARALREGEERFRGAFDHAAIGMALVSPEGRWLRVNPALCRMLGYPADELLVTDFQTITHPDDLGADLELVGRVLRGELDTYQMEKRYLRKGGPVVHTLLAVSLVRGAGGEPLYFVSQVKDITERKRAEEELRESRSQLALALDAAGAGVWALDLTARAFSCSDRAGELHGLPPGGAPDHAAALACVHPDDLPRVEAALRRTLETGGRYQAEYRVAGHDRWLAAFADVQPGPAGPRLVGLVQDVTDRRRAERALRESEERYRVLFEQSSDAHLIFDEADGILDCNRAAVEMLRCADKRDVLAVHPAVLSPELQPDGRRSLEKCVEMDAAARRHGYHRFDWLHRRFDGETFPCEVTLTPVELGGRTALLVVWHDLTERVRAERALRAGEERYRAVVQVLAEGVVVQDRAGAVVACNDRAPEILGLTSDQLTGLTSLDPRWQAVREDGSPMAGADHPAMVVLRTGAPAFNTVMGVRTPDGELRWLTVNAVPLPDPDAAGAVVVSFHDVTAVRAANDRLRASVREKEVMLQEIHHRVKNNLQIISTLLELQSDGLTDPAAVAAFRESRGRVRSMSLIHERLYRSEDLARVAFEPYLRNLTDDLLRAYRADESVELAVAVSAPPLPLDVAIPLGLLVNELVSNCLKYAFAGRAGGMITVSLDPAGPDLVLAVADDGVGLPPGLDVRGAGSFGLQLVSTLADQLGGGVAVDGAAGTRFTIRFPARG